MEENINDFLGIADSSIDSIKNLNTQLDLTITKLGTLAEQAELLNKNLQNAGIKEVTKSMDEFNTVTDKINKTNSERLNIEREIKVEGQKATKIIMSEVDAWKQVDKVLQETTISFGELSQQLVDQQYKLDRNKAKQKELRDEIKNANTDLKNGKITREEYTTVLDRNNEKLADLTISEARYRAELSKSKTDLKVLVNEQKSAEGSMDQMNARLGYLRDTYRKLSQSERENADVGGVLEASISELDDALKMLDKQIGNNQRNVGNYEIGNRSLREVLRELKQELGGLTYQYDKIQGKIAQQKTLADQLAASKGKESTEYKEASIEVERLEQEYVKLKARMVELQNVGGDMQDAMSDTSASLKNMGDDTANIKAVAEGAELMVNGFQVVQASMVALGIENEDLLQIFAKMQIFQQGINSVMAIANTLQKESIFMLKIREIRDKVRLAYTEALTAQQIKNTAATAASAVATEGLAGAEATATKASFSLSAAIKAIPGIGWIIGIIGALTALGVILYKVLSAEKELTSEQLQRKKLANDLNDINQKVNEQTLESSLKVRLYVSELKNVKKGSEEWKNIVAEINELTGLQLDTIKATPSEIEIATKEWIKQYKVRITAEQTLNKIVESELEFQRLRAEYFQSGTDPSRRREIAEQLKLYGLTQQQVDDLVQSTNNYKDATTVDKTGFFNQSKSYWNEAEKGLTKLNSTLENSIDLTALLTGEKPTKVGKPTKTNTKDNTIKNLQDIAKTSADIEQKRIETIIKNNEILVNTLNELEEIRLNNSTISENELTDRLITLEKSRSNEIIKQNNIAKDNEIKGLEVGSKQYLSVVTKYESLNQLALEKSVLRQAQIRKEGYSKTVAEIKRQIELSRAGTIVQQGGVLSPEQESGFAISGLNSQINALDEANKGVSPFTDEFQSYVEQRKLLEAELTLETEKQSQLRIETLQREKQQQLELTAAIGGAVFAIGDALTQNIKDEKKRVQVEQGLAVAKVLFNQAIAISEAVALAATTSGSVYTIPIAIATAVGSIVTAMFTAQQAISQANASVSSASAYAEGTSYHTGGAAIVGEGGQPELVKAGGRAFVVDQPTYFKDFPIGAQVIPFDKMSNEQADMSETNELLKQIAGKQQVNINFGRTTNSQIIKGLTRTTILNRRFKA